MEIYRGFINLGKGPTWTDNDGIIHHTNINPPNFRRGRIFVLDDGTKVVRLSGEDIAYLQRPDGEVWEVDIDGIIEPTNIYIEDVIVDNGEARPFIENEPPTPEIPAIFMTFN